MSPATIVLIVLASSLYGLWREHNPQARLALSRLGQRLSSPTAKRAALRARACRGAR